MLGSKKQVTEKICIETFYFCLNKKKYLKASAIILLTAFDGKLAFGGVTRTEGAGEVVEGMGTRGLGLPVAMVTGEDNTSSGSIKEGCRQ